MELAFMRFCGKPFAENLTDVTITADRDISEQRLCSGENLLDIKGSRLKTVTGAGELSGDNAKEKAEYMRSAFFRGEKGVLVIPDCKPMYAALCSLSFSAEGENGVISYKFEFREHPREKLAAPLMLRHTVSAGDNLWTLAREYGTTPEELLRLNPQIIRPDWLKEGEEVTVLWK